MCRSSNERSCGPDVQITSATDQPSPAAMVRGVARPVSPRERRPANARSSSTAIFAKTCLPLRPKIRRPQTEPHMTTPTTVPLESRLLTEGYGAGAWHGPDMKAALADVKPVLAFWRPASGRHNIAELVLHHAYYVRAVRSQISGQAAEPFVLPGEDWFAADDQKPMSWPKIQATLESEQQRLAELVAAIAAGTVTPVMAPPDRFNLILGITCHAIYHAGQVQLIKRLRQA